MSNPSLQAVIRARIDEMSGLNPRQWQVCRHILDCRTEALGGFALHCDVCEEQAFLYHACRDRHCPRCQRQACERWCERQREALLPTTYHHLVFTVPDSLNGWVEVHPEVVYGLLFGSAWGTLSAFGSDPKRLDGAMGAVAMLHTWGQTLVRHVHLHCLVPGGALGADGTWHSAKSTYLFPVRALSRHFRGRFVSGLRRAYREGQLPRIADAAEVDRVLDALMAKPWVVYSKPCLTRTETVVDYLGRYSHRIALSDSRLLDFDGERVALSYKDYRDGGRKVMDLSAEELLRRFLLHVLPKGFVRVRHYGFLANRCRTRRLGEIRAALDSPPAPARARREPQPFDGYPCPRCRRGHLRPVTRLAPQPKPRATDPGGGSASG